MGLAAAPALVWAQATPPKTLTETTTETPTPQAQPKVAAKLPEPQGLYRSWQKIRPPMWTPTHPAQLLGQSLVLSARGMAKLEQHEAAALAYLSAAEFLPELGTLLAIEAARELLEAKPSMSVTLALKKVEQLGALNAPVQGAGLIQALASQRLSDGPLPAIDIAQGALTRSPDDDAACAWLADTINPKQLAWDKLIKDEAPALRQQREALAQLLHGHCIGPKERSEAQRWGAPISAKARQQRAELLHSNVRFYLTKAEIEQLDLEKLSLEERCQMQFLLGKTLYRIRKERDGALPLYTTVVTKCNTEGLLKLRLKALYAAGKRAYEIDKLDLSKGHFEALHKADPSSRYADDALYYLAKIARAQKRPKDAHALMERAIKETPAGDMLFELVWEQTEQLYRDKKHSAFIKAISALKLPEHDENYFSQARLEYFVGMAHMANKAPKRAIASWLKAWERYPFSFYGYLSWARLKQAKATIPALARPEALSAAGLFDEAWSRSPAALLASLGLYTWAAQQERLTQSAAARDPEADDPDDEQRAARAADPIWRLAWLYELAGKPEVSHNLARRKVPGAPWGAPVDALRPVRWLIAWPNPFGALVKAAVDAEAKQNDKITLNQAFPLAIMREESSFIPTIESYAGALGLMQLMPRTALAHDDDIEGDATPEQLKRPEVNIRVGVDHLFTLSKSWDAHPAMIAASYNAGSGGLRRWVKASKQREIGLFVEDITSFQTRNYTKRVVGSYLAYQWLLGADSFDMKVIQDAPKK